jgi:hypothetical protein
MQYCHITDTKWDPQAMPDRYAEIAEGYRQQSWERQRADGWRVAVPYPDEPGYRHDASLSAVVFGSETATEVPDAIIDIAAEQAQQAADAAAAQAEYLAGVDILPRPLQGAFETRATDGHVYGVEVDPDGDGFIPVQRESTRLTQAEYEAARAAKLEGRQTHRDRIAAIKTDLDQVETALDQIDVAATGPMGAALTALNAVDLSAGGTLGTAIAATTGATKTALQQVRLALVAVRDNAQTAVTESRKAHADTKTAAKNLRQATEKMRREVR